jgi:hypothetical protein
LRKSNGFGILETGFQGRFLLPKTIHPKKENIMPGHKKHHKVSAKEHVKKAGRKRRSRKGSAKKSAIKA